MARLNSLMTLQDGWDGPSSRAITKQAFMNYSRFVAMLGPHHIRLDAEPMPTPDGGLRMEWNRGRYNYVAELQGDGGMYLCLLGPTPRDDMDAEFETADIARMIRFFQDGTIVN